MNLHSPTRSLTQSRARTQTDPSPTLETILAKAVPQSAHYDLRETASLFQDDGITPITGSGDPLGRVSDLFGNGNHAVATGDTRPEYWIDPLTDEPCVWYDVPFVGSLTWPTVEGAVGTFCVAYTTGAQVFDLTAGESVPGGPMIACYFFDFVLSDAEAAVMLGHMQGIVADSTWHGYAGPQLIAITPYTYDLDQVTTSNAADRRLEFSVDADYLDQWPLEPPDPNDMFTYFRFIDMSVPRQRFRYALNNPAAYVDSPHVEWSVMGITTPDLGAKVSRELEPLYVPFGGSAFFVVSGAYGSVNWQLRGQPVDRYAVTYLNYNYDPNTHQTFLWNPSGPLPALDNGTRIVHVMWQPGFDILPGEVFDYSTAPGIRYIYDIERNAGLSMGPGIFPNALTNPLLETVWLNGFTTPQPFPKFPSHARMIVITYSPGLENQALVGDEWHPDAYVSIEACGIAGSIPPSSSAEQRALHGGYTQYWRFNKFTTYPGGHIFPDPSITQAVNLRYNGNQLDQASVDLLLEEAVACSYGAGSDLRLQDNARPSAAGLANVDILLGRGWSVPITPA